MAIGTILENEIPQPLSAILINPKEEKAVKRLSVGLVTVALLLGVASSPVYGWDIDGVWALIQRGGGVNDEVDRAAAGVAQVQSLVETFLERSGYELPAVKSSPGTNVYASEKAARDEKVYILVSDPSVAKDVKANLTAADVREIIKARDRLASDERMLRDVLDTVEKLAAQFIDAGLWIAGELITNPGIIGELTDLGGDLEDTAEKLEKAGGKAEKVLGFIAKLVPFLAMLA